MARMPLASDGGDHGTELALRIVSGAGDGMIGHDGNGLAKADAEVALKLSARHETGAVELVEARRAEVPDAGGRFAHLNDAAAVGLGGCEVQGGHLGERVAHGLIDCAFAEFAAVDVRDGNAEHNGCDSRGEKLEAVAEENEDVWLEPGECFGETIETDADGMQIRYG